MSKLRRRLIYLLLGTLAALLPMLLTLLFSVPLTTALLDTPDEPREKWTYSQFLNEVKDQSIEQVTLNPERTIALTTGERGKIVSVNLPNDPDLEALLIQNNVDITIAETESTIPMRTRLTAFLIVLIPMAIVLLGSALWVWMLIDCAMQESGDGNTKIVWTLIMIFTAWLGALAYFLLRRPQRQQELGR